MIPRVAEFILDGRCVVAIVQLAQVLHHCVQVVDDIRWNRHNYI